MLEAEPNNPAALIQKGGILVRLGEHAEAIELYEQARASESFRQEALAKLGSCLRRNGDIEEAKKVLDEAFESDPEHVNTLIELARVEIVLQEYESAVEHIETILRRRFSDRFLYVKNINRHGRQEGPLVRRIRVVSFREPRRGATKRAVHVVHAVVS